jgi:hypothetical protein
VKPAYKMNRTNAMSKIHLLKTHRLRRFVAIGGTVFLWLALVCLLPRKASNAVAKVGLVIAMVAYCRWADDSEGHPTWGCLIPMRQASVKIKMSPEVEAKIATHRERQTLLRAATESVERHEEQLVRASAGGTEQI